MAHPKPIPSADPADRLMGASPAIQALREQLRHLAAFDTPGRPFVPTLLLQGETGTGKGLLARIAHDAGPRAKGPFVEVNCAAIPETLLEAELFGFEPGTFTDARRAKAGLFETASGGTLFLDEVDALPLNLQGKLLKAIEEKRVRRLGAVSDQPVDVKLIAATQAELGGRVTEGQFRADLYHRLAVVVLAVPPLRERGADALVLAREFLARYAEAHGLPPKRLTAAGEAWLAGHDWPGNVRELGHLMERVTLLHPAPEVDAPTLGRLCLPRAAGGDERRPAEPSPPGPARSDEPGQIRVALARTGGNVVRAARLLGLSRSALRHRMRRYGIDRPDLDATPHPAPDAVPEGAADTRPRHAPPEEPPRGSTSGESRRDSPADEVGWAEPGASTPSWEQKPVAVLAIDLAFPHGGGLDAARYEAWTVASRWEQTIAEKVRGFGGVTLPPLPSLLTVVFGIPRVLEQLPQRAVQAALAVRHLMAEARTADAGEPVPEVRLAVHVGAMVVDVRANDPTARLLAVGETLARPVRLLGHARAGELLVSPQAGRLVEGLVELAPRPLPSDGGPADAVGVYAVEGLRAGRPSRSPRAMPPASPFVGRERDLAVLDSLVEHVQGGHGQVAGIVGEPGMGKSRLLAEVQERLADRPLTWLEGRCLAYGSAVPYLPLLDPLRALCGIVDADGAQATIERVQATLRAAGMAPEHRAPYLLRLLGVQRETDALGLLSPEAIKARTFDTLRQLCLEAGRRRPLVLVIEDLQWIDQTSEAYLAALVESLPGAPILLLATYRPGYRPPWLAKSYATQLALRPLSPDESLHIVRTVAQPRPLPDALTLAILAKADGNPFFLEELARAVGEPDAGGPSVLVPATIQEVLLTRIDRLAEAPRRLLQTAAVLGREFSARLLEAVWSGPGHVETHLQTLAQLEFLAEQRGGEEPGYLFKHALTQEVAYASLLPADRQALHVRAARALEALYTDRLDETPERLAYHYARTVEAEKAIAALTRVAEKGAREFAHAEAAAALEEALRHVERLPAAERDRRRVSLLLSLALSLYFLGRFREPLDFLLRERERVEALDDPALAGPYYFVLSRGYSLLGEYEGVASSAQRAIEAAARCGDDITRGRAHAVLTLEMYWAGRPRQGIEEGRLAVALLEPTAERFWLGQAYRALGFNHALVGEFEQALAAEAQAYAIGEAIGNPQLQSHAKWGTGWIEATRGEWPAGIDACRQGLQRSLNPGNTTFAIGHLGAIYLEQGDTAQAIPLLEQAVEQARRLGFRRAQGWFTTFLADAYRASGRLEEARELAGQGLEVAREAKCMPGVGWAQRALGRVALASGDLAAARAHLGEALATFEAIGACFEVGRTHLALAELTRAAAAGRPGDASYASGVHEAAVAHLAEARQLFQTLRVPRYLERADRLAAEVAGSRAADSLASSRPGAS